MVIALGGRRIDSPDTREVRFPADRVVYVAQEIRTTLQRLRAKVLVCSAACGADLLGLEAAGYLGLRRRVVLPFARDQFRQSSLVDRPGDWGDLYDRVLDDVQRKGDVIVLGFDRTDANAYQATNRGILEEAQAVARGGNGLLQALIVWDGKSRGPDDVTAQFLTLARMAAAPTIEIRTIP